ncbi:type III secretion system stator protein SctL [Aureimonas leprariae]|uniref:Type 3 secretion system stator protein n=1 Tax=Plantimonas leprariae TaxID=2615207 RepID=A0A7V7PL35_9HYPH|nr:type III secretion system stator protein SctL [Aureimonas leprariae]KAB0676849.1 HrpE/YscL family type III secretion apparatus protein [Aureimonas leprariae]
MAGYYRLNDLGFRLGSGAHVLKRGSFEPVEAGEALVVAAEARASEIVASAETAFEAEKRRGYDEGFAAARLEAVERLLGESETLDRTLAGLEGALSDIVVAAVRRLIDDFDDRAKAETLVRTALRQMRREKKAELRVSPPQFATLKEAVDAIVADFPEIKLVDVVEDETLTPPQIVVETAVGRVEGDMGRGLADLERALRAAATIVPEAAQ